jgi:hypothetical protein
MAMTAAGLGDKNQRDVEAQQQFIRPTNHYQLGGL